MKTMKLIITGKEKSVNFFKETQCSLQCRALGVRSAELLNVPVFDSEFHLYKLGGVIEIEIKPCNPK